MNEDKEFPGENTQNLQPQQPQYPPSQQYPQQPPQQGLQYPPSGYYPPPRRNKTGLVIGIAIGAVAVVVLLILLIVLNPFALGIVGKWHVTRIEVSGPYSTYSTAVDFYIEFHGDGTGKSYGNSGNYTFSSSFHWKDEGNNQILITDDNSGSSTLMTYHINGNSLKLSHTEYGVSITYYAQRV